jgi:hypothetical protein
LFEINPVVDEQVIKLFPVPEVALTVTVVKVAEILNSVGLLILLI